MSQEHRLSSITVSGNSRCRCLNYLLVSLNVSISTKQAEETHNPAHDTTILDPPPTEEK
ncbi:hypothetical protein PITC_030450 [Penicillium italicum]|uniref:Uncharacterized protein n=1 Tax=Penicillium italicum TaxID=40296 RepID=A0A0A2L938_PENIT|nr:hypothetical protein PITC_030450 [Penicillium italicum]